MIAFDGEIPARCCATCEHEEQGCGGDPCKICLTTFDDPWQSEPGFWKPKGAPDTYPLIPITVEEEEAFRTIKADT